MCKLRGTERAHVDRRIAAADFQPYSALAPRERRRRSLRARDLGLGLEPPPEACYASTAAAVLLLAAILWRLSRRHRG